MLRPYLTAILFGCILAVIMTCIPACTSREDSPVQTNAVPPLLTRKPVEPYIIPIDLSALHKLQISNAALHAMYIPGETYAFSADEECSIIKGTVVDFHSGSGIENIPVNISWYNPEQSIPNIQEKMIVAGSTFTTGNSDVILFLTVKNGITVQGRVSHVDGTPASGAWVWVEYKYSNETLENQLRFKYRSLGMQNAFTYTDNQGKFVINCIPTGITFLVKCATSMLPPNHAGPFTSAGGSTIPEYLEMTLDETGGWFGGTALDTNGKPAQKLGGFYTVYRPQAHGKGGSCFPLHIKADKDGTYESERFKPGHYGINIKPSGARELSFNVEISTNHMTLVDLTLIPESIYTGIVVDCTSLKPVAGVNIKSSYSEKGIRLKHTTDANGLFWVAFPSKMTDLTFSHPDYGDLIEKIIDDRPPTTPVCLMPAASLTVHVTDADRNPVECRAFLEMGLGSGETTSSIERKYSFTYEGSTCFSNIPSGIGPLKLSVGFGSSTFVIDDSIMLSENENRIFTFVLPPMGEVLVRLPHPPQSGIVHGRLTSNKDEVIFEFFPYNKTKEWTATGIPEGTAKLYFGYSDIPMIPKYTNIIVTAGQTTVVDITYDTLRAGVISGTVHTTSGTPIDLVVNAIDCASGENVASDRSSSTMGAFLLTKLNPVKNYEINVILNKTKFVSYGVSTPGAMPLDIIVPDPIRVTGAVTDADGNAINASVTLDSNNSILCHGTFDFNKVFLGEYSLFIFADGFTATTKCVQVTSKNTDIGIIVLEKRED